MGIPFTEYVKIKDKFCLRYVGGNTEYIAQLQALRPQIEQEMPGLKLFIACADSEYPRFQNDPQIICVTQLNQQRNKFGYIREFANNLQQHPVLKLLEESKIPIRPVETPIPPITTKCVICPYGSPPVQSLKNEEITFFETLAESKGFNPEVDENIEDSGWVIGVENRPLFEAAINGIKTTLIPTGLGVELYKKMFPLGEVYNFNDTSDSKKPRDRPQKAFGSMVYRR
jgi:hypothetical protein